MVFRLTSKIQTIEAMTGWLGELTVSVCADYLPILILFQKFERLNWCPVQPLAKPENDNEAWYESCQPLFIIYGSTNKLLNLCNLRSRTPYPVSHSCLQPRSAKRTRVTGHEIVFGFFSPPKSIPCWDMAFGSKRALVDLSSTSTKTWSPVRAVAKTILASAHAGWHLKQRLRLRMWETAASKEEPRALMCCCCG